jgi:hypothetical protein
MKIRDNYRGSSDKRLRINKMKRETEVVLDEMSVHTL